MDSKKVGFDQVLGPDWGFGESELISAKLGGGIQLVGTL